MDEVNLGKITTKKFGKPFASINWLNGKIFEYVSSVYTKYGFRYGVNSDINVNGTIINTEYLSKMVNNYTIFKKIIEVNNITNEIEFYRFMSSNLFDIYNYKGRFFNSITLPILINTSKKGNIGEIKSLAFFKKALEAKGVIATLISPTVKEDVSGIDSKFIWRGKIITIQVKPYESLISTENIVKAFSQGSLSLNTDYLILYKDESFIIVKGKDVTIQGNYFIFNQSNISAKN